MKSSILLLSTGLPEFNSQVQRTKGIHWSDVLNDLVYTNNLDPDFSDQKDRMTLGRLLEWAAIQHYLKLFPDDYADVGEIYEQTEAGIIYAHPDFLYIPGIVHEFKLTWRSSKGPTVKPFLTMSESPIKLIEQSEFSLIDDSMIVGLVGINHNIVESIAPKDHPIYSDKFWGNWAQVAGYCHMMGLNRAVLELCHPQGDYKNFKVVHNRWYREFSQEDLEGIWYMGVNHAKNFCPSCGEKVMTDNHDCKLENDDRGI